MDKDTLARLPQKYRETYEKVPEKYREIYENFVMPVDTNIDLDRDVILSPENRAKYDLLIREMEHQEEFHKYGLEPVNRLLLYGASGTGKTFSTKALCNKLGYSMIYIDIARALANETVADNVHDIFDLANALGHCLIMLDECDAIAWQRDTGNSDTGTIRRATNTIFQLLDQMNPTNIFVAATNMLHRLDPAFERRFNLKMEFRRPQLNLKEAIKQFMHKDFTFVDDVDETRESIVDRRAIGNTKLSYYEIQGLVERAMKDSILEGKREVHSSRIYQDLADNMKIKFRFHTDEDPAETFMPPEDNYNS